MDWTFSSLSLYFWEDVVEVSFRLIKLLFSSSLTCKHTCILRLPQRMKFSVLSMAVSCEGLEASPQEYSQHGRKERASLTSINLFFPLSSHPLAHHHLLSLPIHFSLVYTVLSDFNSVYAPLAQCVCVSLGLFSLNVRCKGHSHHVTAHYPSGFHGISKNHLQCIYPKMCPRTHTHILLEHSSHLGFEELWHFST